MQVVDEWSTDIYMFINTFTMHDVPVSVNKTFLGEGVSLNNRIDYPNIAK